MKLTIYGGSFDPFHLGHLAIIKAALASGLAKRILVMPLGLAPHKSDIMSFASYRYEMTRLAIKNLDGVEISDYEISRPGQYSYSLDTVKYFTDLYAKRGKQVKINLVYGSDALFEIENWHCPDQLMANARLLIALRGEEDPCKAQEQATYLREKHGAKIKFFNMPAVNVSSSVIRQMLGRGEPVDPFLPSKVADFIATNRPYQFRADLDSLSIEQRVRLASLEAKIRPLMPTNRLIHSVNVMYYAVHLAVRHGLDPMQAALAGLLHDCAKCLPIKDQLAYAKKAGGKQMLNQAIAHGPAGAYYAKHYLGIKDREVLSAIYFHTTCRVLMPKLEQIIYLADKLEFGRKFSNLEKIRKLAEDDLNQAMLVCLQEVDQAMKQRNKKLHPFTRAALKSFVHLN